MSQAKNKKFFAKQEEKSETFLFSTDDKTFIILQKILIKHFF